MSIQRTLCSGIALAAALVLVTPASAANEAVALGQDSRISIAVQPGPLGESLIAVARAAGLTISIDPALVDGRTAPAINGRYTADQAFSILLEGSGLHLGHTSGSSLKLVRGAAVDTSGAEGQLLQAVRVAGVGASAGAYVGAGGTIALPNESANGSTDKLATEGTGSYAPIGTTLVAGAAASIHDTPQSVSVITRQRIEDQRLDNLNDALAATPGIYTAPTSAVGATVISRGFSINNYQIDGSAPLFAGQGNANNYHPQFDLAEFDNVAVLRGGDALISGLGDPGGTINLQRKRPTAEKQLVIDTTVGSWDKHRISVDGSTPLTEDGKLRVRVVAAKDDSHFFYDRAFQKNELLYTNLEYAPDSSTGFNVGISMRNQVALPGQNGLPRYADGSLLNVSPSTCYCFDDDRQRNRTVDTFFEFRHEFSPIWKIRMNLDYSSFTNSYQYTSVNPVIGIATSGQTYAFPQGNYSSSKSRQITGDVTLDGGFMLFGRQQTFTVGYTQNDDKLLSQNQGTYVYPDYADGSGNYFDLTNFNPAGDLNRTESPGTPFLYGYTRQSSAYLQLRLNPIDRLWLTLSGKYSTYEYGYGRPVDEYTTVDSAKYSGFQRPALSVRYDISQKLNVYSSISFIDKAEVGSTIVDAQGKPLPPEKGDNFELGMKYADANGRFNASAAVFRTSRKNAAVYDPVASDAVPYGTYPYYISCCYVGGQNIENSGMEFELSGALTPHWQISAGYTYTGAQKVTTASDSGLVITPPQFRTPRHLFKLATSYAFSTPTLSRLTIGGDVLAQTKVLYQDLIYDGIEYNGYFYTGTNGKYTDFSTPGFAVFNAFARYDLTPKTTLQINVRNLLNKVYYATNGGLVSGNHYGEPRSAQITLSTKF